MCANIHSPRKLDKNELFKLREHELGGANSVCEDGNSLPKIDKKDWQTHHTLMGIEEMRELFLKWEKKKNELKFSKTNSYGIN